MSEKQNSLIAAWDKATELEREELLIYIKKDKAPKSLQSHCNAARSLKITPQSLRQMADDKEIPIALKTPSGNYKFATADVENLREELARRKAEKELSKFPVQIDFSQYPAFDYVRFIKSLTGKELQPSDNDRAFIDAKIENLPNRTRQVIQLRFRKQQQKQIAALGGFSQALIHEVYTKGMRTLRHPSWIGWNLECVIAHERELDD
jgi:DNA-directed RNA polymerase specialized sigma subunit